MDWTDIALIIVLALLVISGGFIKRLWGALTEFTHVVNEALTDGNISPEEWKAITEEGLNVWKTIATLTELVALKKRS